MVIGVSPYFSSLTNGKILFISHEFSLTGAPLLLLETAVALIRAAVDVRITNIGHADPRFPLPRELKKRLVPVEHSFDWANTADLIVINTAVSRSWLQRFLERHPGAGKKVIWWIHEIDVAMFGVDMSCLAECSAVVFDSQASSDVWQKSGNRLPRTVTFVHPSLTREFVHEAEKLKHLRPSGFSLLAPWLGRSRENVRKRLGIGPEHILVSLFGTYGPYKGHDLLLQTMATAVQENWGKQLRLLLIGLPSRRMRLSFVRKLTSNERKVIGFRRSLNCVVDLKPYYLASDIFVLNTQNFGETFGRVTIEAMAFHLPILGTNAGGTKEIVQDGLSGLLHPLGRGGQAVLMENLKLLVQDAQRRSVIGEAAYRRVCEMFMEDRFHKQLAQVMRTVISTG
jgi:glycosyltransferase involved in cell wall biosynthesis